MMIIIIIFTCLCWPAAARAPDAMATYGAPVQRRPLVGGNDQTLVAPPVGRRPLGGGAGARPAANNFIHPGKRRTSWRAGPLIWRRSLAGALVSRRCHYIIGAGRWPAAGGRRRNNTCCWRAGQLIRAGRRAALRVRPARVINLCHSAGQQLADAAPAARGHQGRARGPASAPCSAAPARARGPRVPDQNCTL